MNTLNLTMPTSSPLLRDQSLSLRRHLLQCHHARGRWFGASVWAERAHGLIAPRIVSSIVVLALILGLATALA
jgi:hypothetical protein